LYYCCIEGAAKILLDMGMRGLKLVAAGSALVVEALSSDSEITAGWLLLELPTSPKLDVTAVSVAELD
jgi:hypothetical protein